MTAGDMGTQASSSVLSLCPGGVVSYWLLLVLIEYRRGKSL